MKYLLDTHTLLWLLHDPDQVPKRLVEKLSQRGSVRLLSIASLWEATIKIAKGRLSVPTGSIRYVIETLPAMQIDLLPITTAHLLALETLPPLHKDPFDRILAAQSLVKHVPLATVDRTLQQYGIATVWDV